MVTLITEWGSNWEVKRVMQLADHYTNSCCGNSTPDILKYFVTLFIALQYDILSDKDLLCFSGKQ